MEAVIDSPRALPAGYRRAGSQAIRLDMAEKLFRAAHDSRSSKPGRAFLVETSLATSMGLSPENFRKLMREAGFRPGEARVLPDGTFGPPAPVVWTWRPPRRDAAPVAAIPAAPTSGAFAALAALVR
jgi:ATP-dependent RNA helicase SUPV3L1/SUV3